MVSPKGYLVVNLTPGSLHDLSSLLILKVFPYQGSSPLDLPEGAELYLDRGYESHFYEDLLREAEGIAPMVIRRRNSRRYVPWLQYLAISGEGHPSLSWWASTPAGSPCRSSD